MEKLEHPLAKDLMTSHVVMLPSNAKFRDLVNLMYDKRLSAVIIHDKDSEDYYLISHSVVIDFLKKDIDIHGYNDIYEVPLLHIMRGPIKIINKYTPIDDVIRLMTERGYKRVLIGDKKKPVGILSVRDIISWNNKYFQKSEPILIMLIDNSSSILIGKHIFADNSNNVKTKRIINKDLLDLYGGALSSLNAISDEVLSNSGETYVIQKEKYSILLEPRNKVTGILISTQNSISLRRRLFDFMNRIEKDFTIFNDENYMKRPKLTINLDKYMEIFTSKKNVYTY